MIIRKTFKIFALLTLAFTFIIPTISYAGAAEDLAFIRDKDNKRVVRKWVKKNYRFVGLEKVDRHVLSTWIEDKPEVAAVNRTEALKAIWEITQASTFEHFATYSNNILTGDKENALEPWGNKSSYDSAEALMNELAANTLIAEEFDIQISYANAGGEGAVPIDHAVVELYPIDDEGPAYLVDRYYKDQMHEIQDHWRYTYASKLFEKILGAGSSDNYETDYIEDPTAYIEALESRITYEIPPVVNNCLIDGIDDLTEPVCSEDEDKRQVFAIPGIMQTWEEVTSALDSAVFAITDGNDDLLPCGNSISKKYFPNFCGSSLTACGNTWDDLNCSSTTTLGIDYVSRCAFGPVTGQYIYYVVAYQETETSYTCSDFPFDPIYD